MIRQVPNFHAKYFLSIAIAGAMMLTACGNDPETKATPDASMALALDISALNATGEAHDSSSKQIRVSDGNTCTDLMDTIHAHREAVAATSEWKTFSATSEWQQVKADGEALKRQNCKHNDPNPSYACAEMVNKIKADFSTAQATDAYKACAALPVWKELEKNYDEARENQCLPSQREETQN